MLTIKALCKGLYEEKGSKFFAFAYPIKSDDDQKKILNALKSEHKGASHFCYAYRLNNDAYKVYDAGEPKNSAGMPILGQILSKELYYTLVVVIRYYGGTKLGVGGLQQAYKSASADCLSNADLVTIIKKNRLTISADYSSIDFLIRYLKKNNIVIEQQNFDEICKVDISITENELTSLKNQLKDQLRLYQFETLP